MVNKFYTEEEFNTRQETSITLPRDLLREFKDKYAVGTFVETGAYRGDAIHMAAALNFSSIRSVEIDPDLYNLVIQRFAFIPQVRVWFGDSVIMLPKMIGDLDERSIFWLDAHTNGTPLLYNQFGESGPTLILTFTILWYFAALSKVF